jgi:hypothetical protein
MKAVLLRGKAGSLKNQPFDERPFRGSDIKA